MSHDDGSTMSWCKNCCSACVDVIYIANLRFVFPIVIFPNRVVQEILQQRGPSEGTGQRQVALWCLLDIINEFRCPEPTQLAFDFSVLSVPANLSAEDFKVSLALTPLFLLDRVTELASAELKPESFNGGQICVGDVLHVSEIDEITSLFLSTRDNNKGITSELCCK